MKSLHKNWLKAVYFLKVFSKKILHKSKEKPYFTIGITLVLGLIIFLIVALSSVSASRLELLSYEKEIKNNQVCHEECRYNRQLIRESIAEKLLVDEKLKKDFAKYFTLTPKINEDKKNDSESFFNSDVKLNSNIDSLDDEAKYLFLEELLQIIKIANINEAPPDYLIDYLANQAGNEKIKALIVRDFLTTWPDPQLIDYYYLLLTNAETEDLKKEAIKALSLISNKEAVYQASDLEIIINLLFDNSLSPSVSLDLIYLLSDYYSIFPEQTKQALYFIYDYSLDPVHKFSSLEILHSFNDFTKPDLILSDDDWGKYMP